MGHFHPTESIHDKISSLLLYLPEILVHVSRPIRWDSDHVVILNDDLIALSRELVRTGSLDRVRLATDFFDASINRIGAWVIGVRSLQKSLLFALLEPVARLKKAESAGNLAERLALMEESKTLPFGAVWDYFCLRSGVPAGASWLSEMTAYETRVLRKRK
jgi:L-rhamnose isomerase